MDSYLLLIGLVSFLTVLCIQGNPEELSAQEKMIRCINPFEPLSALTETAETLCHKALLTSETNKAKF